MNVCVLQETQFHTGDHDGILSSEFQFFSAYYDGRSIGVSCLVRCSLEVACTLALADPAHRVYLLVVLIKDKEFRSIGVYAPGSL